MCTREISETVSDIETNTFMFDRHFGLKSVYRVSFCQQPLSFLTGRIQTNECK